MFQILDRSILCAGLALAGSPAIAQAQPAKDAKNPPAEVRYFTSLGDLLGDLPVDSFIRENRQGGKVTSATLDVCYPVSAASDRKDRFSIDLKVDGPKLSGSGESIETRTPVTVNLTRKPVDKAITFEGKIVVGGNTSLVSSADNSEIGEEDFQRSQTPDNDINEKPDSFVEVSPNSIGIRVKRENFVALVKNLKDQNVQVTLESIATDCSELRTGEHIMRVTVDPARAPALVAMLRGLPGVIAAGWSSGTYDMERAVRVAAAEWREGDRLNRDKLASAIGNAAAKSMSAKPSAANWNERSGEVVLSLKRPSQIAPALELTETLSITALIGPEKPADKNYLIIWLGVPTSKTTDESAGPHLEFGEVAGSDEESPFGDDDGLIRILAADLKGQRWDSGKMKWK